MSKIMRKKILLPLVLLSTKLIAADNTENLYLLSNQSMDVVTKMKEYPSDGHFHLTTQEADLTTGVAKNDYMIGEYAANKQDKSHTTSVDCPEKKFTTDKINKAYGARSFRIGAISINALSDFEKIERKSYSDSAYGSFMNGKGYSTYWGNYSWQNLMTRFKEYDPKADAGTNASKLAEMLKKETGLDVPKGALASEFMYNDLLSKPTEWKTILSKSKDSLSFDEKVFLVAKLGGRFGDDYNYDRIGNGPEKNGVVPIETLLKNLSTADAGGVCRDVSLAQSQMLKALGVKDSYSVAYNSNRGGHATLLAVDPNDKNRIIKMNYGELYTDDGRKGSAALDQNNSLPNVGMQYRIYDSNGKPLASVPTEIGNLLRDATNQEKAPGDSVRSYNLQRAYIGNDYIQGALFTGKTSTGENIDGISLYGKASSKYLDVEAGGAGFKTKADKMYYTIDEAGVYGYGKSTLKATVYEGKYGTVGTGVGASIEVMQNNVNSTDKSYGSKSSAKTIDVSTNVFAKASYDLDLSPKDKIGVEAQVKGRIDKGNVADEGSYQLNYDSTTLISRYDHQFTKDLKGSVEVATVLARYGESASFKAALTDDKNSVFVSGNTRLSDTPSFFPGMENNVRAGYARTTNNGWTLKLQYENNLDSKTQLFMGTAEKKF